MQRQSLILAVTAIWIFAAAEHLRPQQRVATPPRNASQQKQAKTSDPYAAAVELAKLQDPAITESSGLIASRSNPGLFWTHNDSGDGPFIYAFDRTGKSRGVWRVNGASARDWEDIAAGPGPDRSKTYLYVGDIGDNSENRATIEVYRFPEPVITPPDTHATKAKPRMTSEAETIRLQYPDGKHDAETLLVHPSSGDLYVITKKFLSNAGVYKAKAPLEPGKTTTLTHLGSLKVPSLMGGFVTGGDISPDGRRVAICDYTGGYEYVIRPGRSFDEIWRLEPTLLALGVRHQGEAIAYRLDGSALLMTSEGLHSPLLEIVRK